VSARFDAVVVGAGVAGAHLASVLQRAGLSVALVDRRPLTEAGPRWVNGVAPEHFDLAGVTRPAAGEFLPHPGAFHMVSPSGARRITLPSVPILSVDMRKLGDRLRGEFLEAGGTDLGGYRASEIEVDEAGRPRSLRIEGAGGTQRLDAAVYVDAAGRAGVLRRQVRAFGAEEHDLPRSDLCAAAQAVHAIDDRQGAEAYLERAGAHPGDLWVRTSMAGGYSTIAVSVSLDLSYISILTGAIPEEGTPSGADLLRRFVTEERWIGAREFGGAGIIPLGPPWAKLTASGIALLGDCARQVFASNASGIGFGLVAARQLGDAIIAGARAGDLGGGDALFEYCRGFHRMAGGLIAWSDAFRRFAQSLDRDEVEAMYRCGLLTRRSVEDAMRRRLPHVGPIEGARLLLRSARVPKLGARLGAVVGRLVAARSVHRAFPEAPNEEAMWWYREALRRIAGAPLIGRARR